DEFHPCQALADVMTIRERLGGFEGVQVAWLGDGNNVCASLSEICSRLARGFVAASPEGYELPGLETLRDPREAVRGANVVVTDAWTSMGQEDEAEHRRRDFGGDCIDGGVLGLGAPGAVLLPRLP